MKPYELRVAFMKAFPERSNCELSRMFGVSPQSIAHTRKVNGIPASTAKNPKVAATVRLKIIYKPKMGPSPKTFEIVGALRVGASLLQCVKTFRVSHSRVSAIKHKYL